MPTVSILIPCYNCEEWVSNAIDSALAQTYPVTEVIVFDDGSHDRSLDVIKSFGDRIIWKQCSHRGGNPTRNDLLASSSGEWVQFLDADDYLLPTKISDQLQCAKDENIDAIYGPTILEWITDGRVTERIVSTPAHDSTPVDHWLKWQLGQTGTLLWRRDSLLKIGGWNDSQPCCQDNEITFRGLKAGLTFAFCASAGNVYRLFEHGTLTQRDPLMVLDEKALLLDSMLDWLRDRDYLTRDREDLVEELFFQLARAAAARSISAGAARERKWRRGGLINDCPSSLPVTYRISYRLLGFSAAEYAAALARFVRRRPTLEDR